MEVSLANEFIISEIETMQLDITSSWMISFIDGCMHNIPRYALYQPADGTSLVTLTPIVFLPVCVGVMKDVGSHKAICWHLYLKNSHEQ